MKWQPILLGIIDDPYSRHFWILPVLSIVGSLLCVYRYKLAWGVIPIVCIASIIFLVGFLEPENYRHITSLSDWMPRTLVEIGIFFALPFLGTYLSWLRLKNKNVAPA
jgi:hypothetical protein